MAKDIALSVEDVFVSYVITSSHSLLRRKQKQKKILINAVNGVSFKVSRGEVLGIIGKNGAGKSTLLQSVAGIIEVDRGTIDTRDNKVSLMSLGSGFHQNLSGRENIILSGMLMGFSKADVQERMDEIISFSELSDFIDFPVRTYSSGMYAKLSFAINTILDNDILLIDEVLSVGDERFKQKSYRHLRKLITDDAHTVILVSHSLDKVKTLCDRVIWMDNGRILQIGAPREVITDYLAGESSS